MIKDVKFSTLVVKVVIIYFFISCQNNHQCFHSRGDETREIRRLEPFNHIKINNLFNVFWHYDSSYKVEIVSGKNLLPYIETRIQNNYLTITDNNRCNWLRKYKRTEIHIYCPTITSLEIWGSGDYCFKDTLFSDSLLINNWADIINITLNVSCRWFAYSQNAGTGDTYINGKAGISYLWISGMGYLNAKNFICQYNYVTNKSTGDCYVYARKEAGINIYKSGNVYLYGNPDGIRKNIVGIGKLYIMP